MTNLFRIDLGDFNAFIGILAKAGLSVEMVDMVRKDHSLAKKMIDALKVSDTNDLIIDLDADPFCPEGWTVESHKKGGKRRFNQNEIGLHLAPGQKNGKSMVGRELRKMLADQPVMNANQLDWYLAHPDQIPEDWKGKYVFFWGTVYRFAGGGLCVRYLCWGGGRWRWGFCWLGSGFDDEDPAAVRK